MRAAFSSPPKPVELDLPAAGAVDEAADLGRDSLENPMFVDSGPPRSQPIHTMGVGSTGSTPIEPSLLEPLDSASVEVVKERLQKPAKEPKSQVPHHSCHAHYPFPMILCIFPSPLKRHLHVFQAWHHSSASVCFMSQSLGFHLGGMAAADKAEAA